MKLIEKTKYIIEQGVKINPKGVIAWSGGKDSMVLMHIMRSMGHHLPMIFFREPWQPSKYRFHDNLIADLNLEVYTWHPTTSCFQQNGDEFELQNYYSVNGNTLTCPSGITPRVEGKAWACAIDMLQRPKQESLTMRPFDCIWIGHKGCDSDPILGGDVGTRIDARMLPGKADMMFPLRDWSHRDIWDYIDEHNVPVDHLRYEKVNGVWGERSNKEHNLDYVHACTNCIDRRDTADRFVHCPKLGMTIENINTWVPWDGQQPLSYMQD